MGGLEPETAHHFDLAALAGAQAGPGVGDLMHLADEHFAVVLNDVVGELPGAGLEEHVQPAVPVHLGFRPAKGDHVAEGEHAVNAGLALVGDPEIESQALPVVGLEEGVAADVEGLTSGLRGDAEVLRPEFHARHDMEDSGNAANVHVQFGDAHEGRDLIPSGPAQFEAGGQVHAPLAPGGGGHLEHLARGQFLQFADEVAVVGFHREVQPFGAGSKPEEAPREVGDADLGYAAFLGEVILLFQGDLDGDLGVGRSGGEGEAEGGGEAREAFHGRGGWRAWGRRSPVRRGAAEGC
ncbi:MAG: hypothetical protein M5U12_02475 [Verrucomicrobia bacterium]|nr:hypothetical protein [Verrucomicrobiota bacterium]